MQAQTYKHVKNHISNTLGLGREEIRDMIRAEVEKQIAQWVRDNEGTWVFKKIRNDIVERYDAILREMMAEKAREIIDGMTISIKGK